MTFGFNDYDKRLNDTRFNFTPKGWDGFSSSIKEKGIVGAVINQQQLMTAYHPKRYGWQPYRQEMALWLS
jgi:intracellular multiplication protein IcmL